MFSSRGCGSFARCHSRCRCRHHRARVSRHRCGLVGEEDAAAAPRRPGDPPILIGSAKRAHEIARFERRALETLGADCRLLEIVDIESLSLCLGTPSAVAVLVNSIIRYALYA